MDTVKGKSRVPRERVLEEHRDGSPHLTVCEQGGIHHYPSRTSALGSSGPSQVATDGYRDGWDRAFAKKKTGGAPS